MLNPDHALHFKKELRKEADMSSSVGTSGKISQPRMFGKKDFKEVLARELFLRLKPTNIMKSLKSLYFQI